MKISTTIDLIDRKDAVPNHANEVLVWGLVPSISTEPKISFLGVDKYNFNEFGLDGSGHCGMVKITHWAEIPKFFI